MEHPVEGQGNARNPGSQRDARFGLLGPLEVRLDGEDIPVTSAKLRSLLAALLLHPGRMTSFNELVDAIWGDEQPDNPRRALQLNMTRLRALLADDGSIIVTCPGGYRIDVGGHDIDLARFEHWREVARQARTLGDIDQEMAACTNALAEWRGEPLADVASERLQNGPAHHLREIHLQAIEDYLDVTIRCGKNAEAIAELLTLTVLHPSRERFWALLMTSLHLDGRRSDALDAFHAARKHLAEELGLDPGEELRSLHETILTGRSGRDTATQPPIPRQLPSDIRGFAGRTRELAFLNGLLDQHRSPSPVIAVITGMAGVGKTTLALHWARHVADRFPDGTLWINLCGYDRDRPVTPERALTRFLRALGVPGERIPLDLADQVGLYRSLIDGRRLLIVLDNASDAEQVLPLLSGGVGCAILVTSRHELPDLIWGHAAHRIALDLLDHDEARQMLAQRLGSDLLDTPAADQLVDICARLPLALALVAARVAVQSNAPLELIIAQLGATDHGLGATGAGAMAELNTTFSWSYRALSMGSARLFRLLGLHPGPDIAPQAAASLMGLSTSQALPLLTELCQMHLLGESAPGRYSMHDLLRAYAAELVQGDEPTLERSAAMQRMFDHYLNTAYPAALTLGAERDPIVRTPVGPGVVTEPIVDHRDAIRWFGAEHNVLLALIELAPSTEFHRYTWSLAAVINDFLSRRGFWRDWIATQQLALDTALEHRDLGEQARANRGLARAYNRTHLLAEAEEQCRSALDVSQALGDQLGLAWTYMHLAELREQQGRQQDALAYDLQGLALFRAGGDRHWEAVSLNHVGWDYAHLGEYEQAVGYCRQALTMMQALKDRFNLAAAWDSLGFAHHQLGEHSEAIRCFDQAVALYREFGSRFKEANVLVHLGDAQLANGHREAAHSSWHQAFDILMELQHRDALTVKARLYPRHASAVAR